MSGPVAFLRPSGSIPFGRPRSGSLTARFHGMTLGGPGAPAPRTTMPRPRHRARTPDRAGRPGAAIVVGGAVAKGAFAAGALSYLALRLRSEGTPIRALVGTSSGALNATVLAAGVRAGRQVTAAKELVRLWRDEGGILSVLDLDVASAVRLGGISGPRRVVGLLESACTRARAGNRRERVTLRVVVAPLAGVPGAETSFEAVERFHDTEFEDPDRRARMFRAAAASAAFPFAFRPVDLEGRGPAVDGGIVNNTPIAEAIERDPDVGTVYVVVAEPPDVSLPKERAADLHGVQLGSRLAEMLVNERLVRDLAEARAVNAWLETLDRLQEAGELSPAARRDVVEGLYHRPAADLRRLEIVEIRPGRPLHGSAFDGFFRPALRRAYLRAGWEAARDAFRRARPAASPRPSARTRSSRPG